MEKSRQGGFFYRFHNLISELKRRKVLQTTGVYLVAVWGFSAGAADIFELMNIPERTSRYFVIALFSLTPVVVTVSWLYDLTAGGIERDYGPEGIEDSLTIISGTADRSVLTATYLGRKRSFKDDFVVGRDDSCELQIIDPLISRRHARFEHVDGRWRVRDLGSANGTVVNGQKIDNHWLEEESAVVFYPKGPKLIIKFLTPESARTTVFSDPNEDNDAAGEQGA